MNSSEEGGRAFRSSPITIQEGRHIVQKSLWSLSRIDFTPQLPPSITMDGGSTYTATVIRLAPPFVRHLHCGVLGRQSRPHFQSHFNSFLLLSVILPQKQLSECEDPQMLHSRPCNTFRIEIRRPGSRRGGSLESEDGRVVFRLIVSQRLSSEREEMSGVIS